MSHSRHLNPKLTALWHGGDYNPEQWSTEVHTQDMDLMQAANFRVATLGVFSWATLEPAEGRYDFAWLDGVIARLDQADRYFILATPSASQPAWMSRKYPEVLRTDADRVRNLHMQRVNYNYSSPIYREFCHRMSEQLAQRYGNHPRLLAWHVSNEYGGMDFGNESIADFRRWLERKYVTLDALNQAWWTRFWGHTFSDWAEIDAPIGPWGETSIMAQVVDWYRFSTDQTVDFMLHEMEPLRRISPEVPITANLMGTYPGLDYRKFAPHLDFVAWDSYPAFGGDLESTDAWIKVAFKHDLTRSLHPQRKWMLMECSPSSSNWYPAMNLKSPGMHRFECLQAVAHGADGVQYFQWRQSRGSQEQYHGAVVGHDGGTESRVFREVSAVGAELETLADISSSGYPAEVALVYDWEVRWAIDAACGPVQRDKGYEDTLYAFYRPFWEAGVPCDIIGLDDDLTRYRVLVAPMAYSLRPGFAERVSAFVEAGGTFIATYMTAWTDENSLVYPGGFLGPLRPILGIWSEEIDALREDQTRLIEWDGETYEARDFCELVHLAGATPLATYGGDIWYRGRPALTVNAYGQGHAYYIAARTGPEFIRRVVQTAGCLPGVAYAPGITVQRRDGWAFVMNASNAPASASINGQSVGLGPWGVEVIRT